MDMEVELFTKRSNEVEMMCSMEDLMNYGTHFTTDEVNNISF